MTLLSLIIKELSYRRRTTLLLCIPLFFSVTLVSALKGILRGFETSITVLADQQQEQIQQQMHELWDDYRKITKDLGFNVLILPKNQNVADFYADDFASTYMPESFSATLANSDIITVQHIVPTLIQKTLWQEQKRQVLVYGVRGEIPRGHPGSKQKSPILETVRRNALVLGYELWKEDNLSPGDSIRLNGTPFHIDSCHDRRGNRDDITVWMNLEQCQEMFDKKGFINAILALECRCASAKNLPNLATIRKDLETILPETQVIEFMSDVIARAEARYEAVQARDKALSAEITHTQSLFDNWRFFSMIIVPVVFVVTMAAVGFLTMQNVRARQHEFGILRALGMSTGRIWRLVAGKAAAAGLCVSLPGYALGMVFSAIPVFDVQHTAGRVAFDPVLLPAVLLLTPFFTVCAAVLTVFFTGKTDAAAALREKGK